MKISKRVMFCAAHSIQGAGKCANKHGHNWVAEIDVECNSLDERGFVADVADIKQAAFKYDHDDLDKYFEQPSTENVAMQIAKDVVKIVRQSRPDLKQDKILPGGYLDFVGKVTVNLIETENNSAYVELNF